MLNILFLFLACLAVYALIWLVLLRKKPTASRRAASVYVCDHCGAQDCECRPENPEKS